MLSSISSFATNVSRPDQDIPFRKKDKDWAKKNAEYIFSYYYKSNGIEIKKDEIELLRRYANGNQPTDIYKERMLGKKSKNAPVVEGNSNLQDARKGWANVDFNSIFSVAPKYLYQLQSTFETSDHEISIQAIDTLSKTKKDVLKEKLWLAKQYEQQLQGVQLEGLEETPLPRDRAELELYDKMGGFKSTYETAMEKVLSHTESFSDYHELKRKIIRDFVISNHAAMMDVYDEAQKVVGVEYIDYADLIIEYSRSKDYSNSRFAGIPQIYTIVELMAMTDLSEDEAKSLATAYSGLYGNGQYADGNDYGAYKVVVLRAFWKSIDIEQEVGVGTVEINGDKVRKSELKSGKIIKKGNKYYKKKKNMLLEKSRVKTVYEAQWVIGSDVVFNYRKLKNIPFNYATKEAILPIHVYKLPGTSIMSRMKPILDQIQLAFLKLQNLRAKAGPDGYAIEMGALENVSMGNKKMRPLDLIELKTATGVLLYKATTAEAFAGQGSQASPITMIPGGYGKGLQDVVTDMELQFQFLADITGIDRMSSVTGAVRTQDSAAATKIAAAGTSTSISALYTGWIVLKERTAESITLRVENICVANKDKNKGYFNIIGEKGVRAIADAGKKYPIQWGITLVARDKQEDINEVKMAVSRAFEMGNIPSSTYMFILNELKKPYNTSYMRHYLAMQEAKAEEMKSKQAQEATMALQQKEQAVNDEKTKAKIAEIQAQSQADIQLEQVKGRNAIIQLITKAQTEVERDSFMKLLDTMEAEIMETTPPSQQRQGLGLGPQDGSGPQGQMMQEQPPQEGQPML